MSVPVDMTPLPAGWLSKDLIGIGGGLNLYVYSAGNSLTNFGSGTLVQYALRDQGRGGIVNYFISTYIHITGFYGF